MRFAIAGAGAVGAYLGALLDRAGHDVILYARGAQLEAIRRDGIRVEGQFETRPPVTGEIRDIAPGDVVFLAVKAHSLASLAPALPRDTLVVSLQNGLPWWYAPLESVDPGGAIAAAIDPSRVIGGIVYFSTEVVAPGVLRHVYGDRLSLGEPGGGRSERCREISRALVAAGLRCPVTAHIREEIWSKLLGNVSLNPISALTRATLAQILGNPETRALARAIMQETEAVAAAAGMSLPVTIDQRLEGAAKVGEHKTSMLQDLEAGRPLELEPIVGAVLEFAGKLGVAMPHTRAVYACAKLLAAGRALS